MDLEEKCGVVYECKCEECGQVMWGRPLGKRAQEDKSVKESDSKSAFSKHQVMTGHKVLSKPVIEGVGVIDSEPRNMHRKEKEAIHIKFREATVNRTGEYYLPDLYLVSLREETREAGRDYHFRYSCTPCRSQAASWRKYFFLP